MNKKRVSIALPRIKGVELKNATVDLENGVVVAEYGEEEAPFETKKGDFLTLKTDSSKVVIFEAMAGVFGGVDTFTIIYDLPTYINGVPTYTLKDVKMPISSFRHSTEEEKALMIEEMEKLGKRYNPETFKVEDIEKDISEIAVNLESAVDYLYEDLHEYDFITTKKHISKLEALSQLMILAEAWNNFDGFYPDWNDLEQKRYYPLFRLDRDIINFSHTAKLRVSLDTHTSNFAFKSKERAEQFGKQFIDLFRIVLSN